LILAAVIPALLVSCSGGTAPTAAATLGPPGVSAWPQAGYDARHSSGTNALGPQTKHIKWTANLGGNITPGPVISVDGYVLQATNAGTLLALDPKNGHQLWHFDGGSSYGQDLSTSPAVLSDGTILWPGPRATLYALSRSGSLLWKETLGGSQLLSPAVTATGQVYLADLGGGLRSIKVSASAHQVLWSLSLGGPDYASPVVGPDGTVYTASNQDLVAVRDLGSSAIEKWRFHTQKLIEVSNAVGPDGTVVVGTNNDHEYGVRPDGMKAWELTLGEFTYSSPAVRPNGIAYFGDNNGRIWSVDAASGKIRYSVLPAKGAIWTSLAVDRVGDAYYGTFTGHIYGYGPTGKQLFDVATGALVDSYPAISGDGTLYLGTTKGKLYAIGD
jgi:outer membrane protein assembly factor BamB